MRFGVTKINHEKKSFKKLSQVVALFNLTLPFYYIGSKSEVTQNLFKLGVVVVHIIIRHVVKKSGQLDDWIKSYGQNIIILEQFFKMATKWQSFGNNF